MACREGPIDGGGKRVKESRAVLTPPPGRHPSLWLLVLITFSGTLAMHMFVPALPDASRDLGASIAVMQLTISLYILGLAVGQLIYGPLSDYFGRRPILLVGLVLYTGAGIAALLAPDINDLIVARLFQALGGCAGLVLGRAIVRDSAAPADAARRLAAMNLVVVAGPGLAPLVGSLLSSTFGWRSIFVLLSGLGILNIVLTWRLLPETGQAARNTTIVSLARDYRGLLSSRAFLGFAMGGGFATTSMYAFIAAAPFIFVTQLHRPLHEVGIYLGTLAVGVSIGSAVAIRLFGRMGIERIMVLANALSAAAALMLLLIVLLGGLSVVAAVGLMALFTFGAGMASPAAMTKAVSVNPRAVGSAAGLYGFTQMAIGAICTSLSGLGQNPALAAAIVLSATGLLAQAAFWLALRGDRSQASGSEG
jgi:DHA1 family bicyclomycin/chloramphenicol resistance-like MFS transporter